MSVSADYAFYVDWNNDGDFGDAIENISAYVIDARWSSGADGPPPNQPNAGTCQLLLRNATGIFSSYNVSSPLWDPDSGGSSLIRPGLKVQITMIGVDSDADVTIMWTGLLESIVPQIGEVVAASTATLSANGIFSRFVDAGNAVDIQTDVLTGTAIGLLLDANDFPAGERTIDAGQSTLSRWWVDEKTTLIEALRTLADEELGRLREGKQGYLIFEDRHHISTNHSTPRVTYGTDSTATLQMWDLKQEDELSNIYNSCTINVRSFNETEDEVLITLTDIWNDRGTSSIPTIAPGATLTIYAELPENSSYISVSTWGVVDYEANTESDGSGSDISADIVDAKTPYGKQLQLTFTNNNASTAHLIVCRIHGTAMFEGDQIIVKSDNLQSQGIYHKKDYPYSPRWFTGVDDAQTCADFIVDSFKDPRPRVTFKIIANVDDAHLNEAEEMDVGDRIHIVDNGTYGLYMDDDFIIDKMSHHVEIGKIHTVEITATAAPTTELEALASPYTALVAIGGIPTGISVFGWYTSPYINSRAEIAVNGASATTAELRAKWYASSKPDAADLRTAAEGGAEFVPNGTTDITITDIPMSVGIPYVTTRWAAGSTIGKWYFVWRFNSPAGYSLWSDGNSTPRAVWDYVDMSSGGGSGGSGGTAGPPANWTVWLTPTSITNQYIPHATRPITNGQLIVRMLWQVRDCSASPSPIFDQLDSGTSPAATKYDGSGANHTYTFATGTIQRTDLSGGGWGTAAIGDLIAIDVRNNGASFDIDHCNFETVAAVTDTTITVTTKRVVLYAAADSGEGTSNPVWNSVRIMVVNPWWEWDTEGYLGGSGIGYCDLNFDTMSGGGDSVTTTFTGPPITVPSGTSLEDLYVRAAFLNDYSMSDGGIWSKITDTGDYVNTNTGDSSGVAPAVTDLTCCQMIRMYFDADDTLLNLVGAVDGQQVLLCLVNTSSSEIVITLDTKYRNGKAFPTVAAVESGGVDGLDIVEEE